MSKLVSLAVLSFNGSRRVLPTLNSCKLQRYADKELIISDDCSSDDTVKIVESWLETNESFFKRVVFLKNKINLGIIRNMHNASSHARGDIFFTLGQGDCLYGPDVAGILADAVAPKEAGLWLGLFQAFSINDLGKINRKVTLCGSYFFNNLLASCFYNMRLKLSLLGIHSGPAMVFTKKFMAEDFSVFCDEVILIEDWSIMIYCILFQRKIRFLNHYLRWYEMGVGISTALNARHRMYNDILKVCRFFMPHLSLECRQFLFLVLQMCFPSSLATFHIQANWREKMEMFLYCKGRDFLSLIHNLEQRFAPARTESFSEELFNPDYYV